MTPAAIGADILGARVEIDGEDAGHVTGVLVQPATGPIGLEVTGSGFGRRFLPLVAATMSDGVVDVPSAFVFVDSCDAYVARGAVPCRDAACVSEHVVARREVSAAVVAGSPPW